ncbi:FlgD immunoglobulin-like domain containing protein [Candidatus Neomarinimicrobiota bacterium]
MKTIKYSLIFLTLIGIAFSQNSIITIGGTGTSATSAHITITTDGFKCPDEYVVEYGASLTTWDPSAICDASTSGDGDIALPVELAEFTVEQVGSAVLLKWLTESEIENLGFMIDRKTDGTAWNEIVSYKTDEYLLGQGTASIPAEYEYLDEFVMPNTTYKYRLADVNYNGIITYHATREITIEAIPEVPKIDKFTVLPAYPNPFNPSVTIRYGLDKDSRVEIQIYDITGQHISTLQNIAQLQGWHSVIWNGTNQQGKQVPAGLYLSRIISNEEVKTIKLMLLK